MWLRDADGMKSKGPGFSEFFAGHFLVKCKRSINSIQSLHRLEKETGF